MTRPELPRRVEQTRALLSLQVYLTLLVLFFMTFLMRFLFHTFSTSRSDSFSPTFVIMVALPIMLWLSTRLFRPGWWAGWTLAFVAELATLVTAIGSILGPFAGIAAVILLALATYVLVNLFRAEVRQFFFGRPPPAPGSPDAAAVPGGEQPRHRSGH
ncbi:hypothetical protein [Actinoplanes sp. NPDC026623]|uniref:hypothetical protein n=1 Tax=Actinoplanes sp. NPDC026623 TaxID=3155610 RepID=UPI00340C3463